MQDIIAELTWRGLISQPTDDVNLATWLLEKPRTLYAGFDPTADSLHAGHLLPVMCMSWLQRFGHKPIVVLGGHRAGPLCRCRRCSGSAVVPSARSRPQPTILP